MYFRFYKINRKCLCIVLLIFIVNYHITQTQFILNTLTIDSNNFNFTVPYNKTLSVQPSNFAYFIQSGTINQHQFYLKHYNNQTTLGTTQFTIKFFIEGVNTLVDPQFLGVKMLISSYPTDVFTLEIVSTTAGTPALLGLPVYYDPASVIKDLQVKIFILNIPMTYTHTLNSTHLSIVATKTPSVAISKISFSVLIITKQFQSYHVGLLIDQIKLGNLDWIIVFNNESFFDPSENTMLVGINSYAATSNPVLDIQDEVDYNFSFPLTPDQRSIFIFYNYDNLPAPTVFQTTIFIFSQIFTSCPNGGFLTYNELYYDSPLNCQSCHITCKTCTTANYSLTMTDQYSCLTCGELKQFITNSQNSTTGQCKCYPGLDVNSTTQQCQACTQDCLGFSINFMRQSTQAVFLFAFSSAANLLIPMQQNLKIYVNDSGPVTYTVSQMKSNFYNIVVAPQYMSSCNTQCLIKFEFDQPWNVLKRGKNESLSQTYQTLTVQNYYTVGDKIPQQLNQAFTVSSMLVGASAGGGLSSMLKMLFQLQQMIEFHKYLNIEMPLVFKQFIESLSIFKFLDVTTVFPFDVDQTLQDLSTSQFDTKGPIKSVYYEYGINFYKNIIPVLVSFGIVLLINFIIFFIFRLIPCKLFWKFSQKLRVRFLITFSDLVESTILPVIVFAHFQLSIIYYRNDFIWMYAMTFGMVFLIICIPFIVVTHVYINRKNKDMIQIYEDLLLDCHLTPATYAFYVVTYYRKVLFSLSLLYFIPGMIQGYCVIAVNTIHLGFIVYVVSQKIYLSKLKMLTRTINALCVLAIQIVMIYYNSQTHSIQLMLELGASCVYLAIIATVTGLIEALIKLFQIIFQNVKNAKGNKQINANEVKGDKSIQKQIKLQKQFSQPIYCNIGKDSITPYNSKDSLQTASVDPKDRSKSSLFDRSRRKLRFLSNLGKNKNNKQKNDQILSIDKNNEQSFEKMIQRMDQNQLADLQSIDDLDYGIRKKQTIKKRVPQKNDRLKSLFSKNTNFDTIDESSYEDNAKNTKNMQKKNSNNSEQRMKTQKQVDEQIKQIQDRIRQKMSLKKKSSQPSGYIQRKQFNSNDSRLKTGNNRIQHKVQRQSTLQPSTQRVKNQQKYDKLIQNINEKKTARRRKVNKTDPLKIKQNKNNKKDQQQDQDDIYYVR